MDDRIVALHHLRLLVDAALLVFAPLLIGAHLGCDPVQVIYLMAAGGAVGFALATAAALFLLNSEGGPGDAGATIKQPL